MSVDLIKTEITKPEIPQDWDYENSVQRVRGFVYKWKSLTEEIAQELWIARKLVSETGNPNWNKSSNSRTWTQYCEDIGSSRQVVNRWLKEWFYPKPLPHVANSGGENEWNTPPEYIESARMAMGSIDVDPASNEQANEIIKAGTYYTEETNGLDKKWDGNVWMNPPYAQPLIADFCRMIVEKYQSGEINQACVLVNNATETSWFQGMLEICKCACFLKGRVRFIDKQWNPSGAPLQGQAVLYFGQQEERFAREFSRFGLIVWRK